MDEDDYFSSSQPSSQRGGRSTSPGIPADGSQSPPKKLKANMSLIPCTIKQIKDIYQQHPEDPARIDGREVNQITIVGLIREVQEQPTNLTYIVDDGTGAIEVKDWIKKETADSIQAKHAQRREGVYIRVIGKLSSFADKRHIFAFHIHPIADFNEVTHHFLEAIHTHLYQTKGPLPPLSTQAVANPYQNGPLSPEKSPSKGVSLQSRFQNNISNLQNQNPNILNNNSINPYANQPIKSAPAVKAPAGGKDLKAEILSLIKLTKKPEGMSIAEIADCLKEEASFNDVRKMVEVMVNSDVSLYNTIDDNHVALTD